MGDEVYIKLREHIDKMPAGYAKTESGAEIKMLKKFYTETQAKIAVTIGPMPETDETIADRLDMDRETAISEIRKMASEGSLFRVSTPDGPLFRHPNFIMGLYEWHVNVVDKEVAELADDIYDSLFENHWKGRKTKQLRVVPVDTSLNGKSTVKSYDIIRDLVKGTGQGPYAAAPCICRVEQIKKGNEVERPMETCLVFGIVAQYYIENGIGKELTVDQLMEKIDECEEASLVPFSTNSKDIVNMCMCDKDSCQLFRNLRKFPKPAEEIHAAFYAFIDNTSCNGCMKCTKKCQIDAIFKTKVSAGKKTFIHEVDMDRCIGCGLCVDICPQNSLSMQEKEVLPDVPENALEMNMRIATERMQLETMV
ncbi:MAG: 4Fe-4S dicluster domain-containing protein [Desulfobacterales bacterium]|nr:4Fe-4S dicluster domain-containing protein [Desulfobacterales bacterium]MCP4159731.1 4Fe-4S dicluster domain-containing protein [Deltaproteobacteria bacterium]